MAKTENSNDVASLRASRENINQRIVVLKEKARDLSAKINALEGPIPNRANRTTKFSVGQ